MSGTNKLRAIATADALKIEALEKGEAQGQAGGWSIIVTKPGYVVPDGTVERAKALPHVRALALEYERRAVRKDAVTLPDWWLSGKRADGRKPNAGHIAFLHRFAVSMGMPPTTNVRKPLGEAGAHYFIWSPRDGAS